MPISATCQLSSLFDCRWPFRLDRWRSLHKARPKNKKAFMIEWIRSYKKINIGIRVSYLSSNKSVDSLDLEWVPNLLQVPPILWFIQTLHKKCSKLLWNEDKRYFIIRDYGIQLRSRCGLDTSAIMLICNTNPMRFYVCTLCHLFHWLWTGTLGEGPRKEVSVFRRN